MSASSLRMHAQGYVGIEDAAHFLGVSCGLLRKREAEGAIKPIRFGPRSARYYTPEQLNEWAESGAVAPKQGGRPSTRRLLPERIPLSYEDEQEVLHIAETVTSSIVSRARHTDWDDAFEDALLGVSLALSRPTDDCPWRVACFTQARWSVLSGIARRSGIPSTEYKAGKRWNDLPPHKQPPVTLDAALYEAAAHRNLAEDSVPRVEDRVQLEELLTRLDPVSRMVVVNSFAHQFELREIAADLGLSPSRVQAIRADAMAYLRENLRTISSSELGDAA